MTFYSIKSQNEMNGYVNQRLQNNELNTAQIEIEDTSKQKQKRYKRKNGSKKLFYFDFLIISSYTKYSIFGTQFVGAKYFSHGSFFKVSECVFLSFLFEI